MKRRIIAFFAAVCMAVSVMPTVSFAADTKPMLRYTFDGTNALSSEDGKNALTLNGGASVTDDGNTGKGLLLDGVDGYALLPSGILSDTMTVTAWVKINKFTTWGRMFDFGADDSNNFFFCPYSGGASRTELKSPSGTDTMDASQETERDWVHYAVTFDKDTVSYYRNGRLISSKSNVKVKPSDIKDTLNYIGKSHYDGDAYLSAVIDDFCVYDTTLTRQQIVDEMLQGSFDNDVMLDSYAIEDGQLITGDRITLPGFVTSTEVAQPVSADRYVMIPSLRLEWSYHGEDYDIIKSIEKTDDYNTTIIFNKPEKTTEIKLENSIMEGDVGWGRDYTLYLAGTKESPFKVTIDTADRSKDVSDMMWGLFFEDINSAADGGLYAELVQNRSFEIPDNDHLYSWKTSGDVKINTENPLNENNPTYVTLGAGASMVNDGFQGMSIKEGEKYDFSVYVRGTGELTVSISQANKDNVGIDTIECDSKDEWKKYTLTLTGSGEDNLGALAIQSSANLDVDMVSLIPQDTYKGHGLRKDLMEALEAMHPKFLRFPGGCAVEGRTMDEAWNWKDTVGDVSERKEMINIWNPGAAEPYMMTYGLGFYEYFQMCEDLGMEPVPILNCGMACQVRSGSAEDEEHLVPMDKLQPYIDDALDLIEFANGTDESNEWVKLRVDMGHKEPFNMHYIGIGNEQYGEIYFERYNEFAKQIHEKYPDINLVTTSGTASSGTGNDLAWNWANANDELADRMDEHYYESADWFRTHAYRYDNYRRDTNTKVFLGEYASKGNAWYNALSEAAFMTGLERNADVVRMASYAPMFAKYGNTQWSAANMIWFNNEGYVLTPNYYVQSLFSNNQGDYSLPTNVEMRGVEKDDTFKGGIVLGSWGTQNEFRGIEIDTSTDVKVLPSKVGTETPDTLEDWDWEIGNGEWSKKDDGTILQTSDLTGSTIYSDWANNSWSVMYRLSSSAPVISDNNYTLSLQAKKNGGGEGFQVGVAAEDNLNYYRVNIGGWGNTTAKIQHIVNGVSAEVGNVAEQSYVGDVHIEDNRWYDVKVEVTDYEIKAYLDGEFICSYTKPLSYGPIYASSVYDEDAGEVIVKVVNTLGSEVPVDMSITGANITDSLAKTFVMAGDTALENSLDNPTAIVPYATEITNAANNFTYTAPANSLSVMRLSADGSEEQNYAHNAYISGYTDGTFRPDNTITRAEAATIIMKNNGFYVPDTDENKFSDVNADAWYSENIYKAATAKFINGYEDGTFKPENSITRAEFATILWNFNSFAEKDTDEYIFSDISSHWAAKYIEGLAERGIISGYSDGTFKPDATITRAEAVTMLNGMLGRNDKPADLENPFSDVTPAHWAYGQILEAAVSH